MELAVTLTATAENPDVGDLYLDAAGQHVMRTSLADEVAQRLTARLSFWRGEWFLDTRQGTPYLDSILVKGPRDPVLRSVFTQILLETEGVESVTELEFSLEGRNLDVRFAVRLRDGTTLNSRDYPPFIVLYATPSVM